MLSDQNPMYIIRIYRNMSLHNIITMTKTQFITYKKWEKWTIPLRQDNQQSPNTNGLEVRISIPHQRSFFCNGLRLLDISTPGQNAETKLMWST